MAAAGPAGSVVVVAGYRDRVGCERRVVVRRADAERYEVLDVGGDGAARLVEALAGAQESPATAAALARDYVERHRQPAAAA